MKDNDIKKAFDNIKVDEDMKSRILNKVYYYVENNKKSKLNILEEIFMFKKGLISVLAISLVLMGGAYLYYRNNSTNIAVPPASYPPVNEEYMIDEEFSNFNLQNLKENVVKVEIKNHENSNVFKEITDKEFINKSLDFLGASKVKYDIDKEKDLAYKLFESVAHSQATGNSITLSFITKNNIRSSVRINLDLDIACINEEYNEVSSEFIKNIKNELKDIKNLNEINIPGLQ